MKEHFMAALLLACIPIVGQGAEPSDSEIKPICGGATPENNSCIADNLGDADDSLNRTYKLLLKEFASGSVVEDPHDPWDAKKATLIAAEKAWVSFRDKHCDAEGARFGAGSGTTAIELSCKLDLTNERLRYLREYEDEIHSEAKVCRSDKAKCAL